MKLHRKIDYVLVVLLLLLSVCVIIFSRVSIPKVEYTKHTYIVQQNDTLWDLGIKYKAPHDDVRDWIEMVKDLNDMECSGLSTGETIQIFIVSE